MIEETKDEVHEVVVIEGTIARMYGEVETFQIKSKDDFDEAQTLLEGVLKQKKEVREYWTPLEEKAFEAKKKTAEALREVRDKVDEMMAPLDKAERWLRSRRQEFKNECDRIDREEKHKLEEKERKAAEKEQAKFLKSAEKTTDPVAEEALIEKADEVVAKPVFQKPTVKKTVQTDSGTRNTWQEEVEIELTDAKKVCAMVANGSLPINVITISIPKIKAFVKSFDKKDGNYEGYSVKRTNKERVTLRK